MNRASNPFAPGAGNQPPELAGREKIMEDASDGKNGFTVPMFDDFMRRAMPEWTAPAPRKVGKKKQ